MKKYIVPGIIEQHIHGGFGVNFNTCSKEDVLFFLEQIKNYGVTKIYPTIHTDEIEIMNRQIKIIYEAAKEKTDVKIMGVHLEGPFINPEKAGVHRLENIKKPDLNEYKKIVKDVDENFIKIVTLAPELDEGYELTDYLNQHGVVVSAGHTLCQDLSKMSQVTHLFNAMGGISHKENSATTQALINKDIYTEIIADGNHIIDDVLKLVFNTKQNDKIILISDALPIAHSNNKSEYFMEKEIFMSGNCAKTKDGVMAGSGLFVFDIIKRLVNTGLLDIETAFKMGSENIAKNLKIGHGSMLEIDKNFTISDVKY